MYKTTSKQNTQDMPKGEIIFQFCIQRVKLISIDFQRI